LTAAPQRVYEGDGSGLCINLRPVGTKSWIQIIAVRGKRRHIGLGPYPLISLKEAREKAWANKRLAYEGKDPIEERAGTKRVPNFKTLAEQVIALQSADHASKKSKAQWESSLASYAYSHSKPACAGDQPPALRVHCLFEFRTNPRDLDSDI